MFAKLTLFNGADSTPTSKNDYERTFFSKGTDSKVVVKLTAPLWKMESLSQLLGHQGGEGVLPTEEKWKAAGTILFDVGPETIAIFITTLQGEWKLEGYVVTLKHERKRAKKVGSRRRKSNTSRRTRQSSTLRWVPPNISQPRALTTGLSQITRRTINQTSEARHHSETVGLDQPFLELRT
ncbi:hypothetical protein BDN71DRAFT_1506517 [Pleurotus eryngii]|uniref:Uncharacterized protein n=1 Tax=Pleurotus eryngii TaxID=5323 RepID=A0A9P5ZZ49_PLEER|nr:hypothetical protein BDN71DRAFT_1506517 [Pleurotus eryngii]